MAAPPPGLMADLVEDILLRFPPDDPASLVRAALVCKEWCRIVARPGFRRRFRELHRTPPLLGVICDFTKSTQGRGYLVSRFIPVCPSPPHADHYGWRTLDARHGRVLRCLPWIDRLEVWYPVTGDLREVPTLWYINALSFSAAVLCAAHGACDHLDCHHGSLVVLMDSETDSGNIRVHVYSSEAGGWSEPIHSAHSTNKDIDIMPPALVGNALYFFIKESNNIFKYELHTQNMSVIQPPSDFTVGCAVLTTVDDGKLGFATLVDSRVYLWSMETGSEGDVGWAKNMVIQLQTLLPVNVAISYDFVGFAHGIGVFLVGTNQGLFSIDLKSHFVRKLCVDVGIRGVIPFLSFYTPASWN